MSDYTCPRLASGFEDCPYGCTFAWPMCHKFQQNKCHVCEGCLSDGWHIRENDRRIIEKEPRANIWRGAASHREPTRKKRRLVEREDVAETSGTKRTREICDERYLRRLGFFDGTLPSLKDLETAYELYKKTLVASALQLEDKELKTKKLKNAFKYIYERILGRDRIQVPSSIDSEGD